MSPTSFDPADLLATTDGDREFLKETLEMLREDVPSHLREIRAAISAQDSAGIQNTAHTMKSMLGNFCAVPACEAARALELAGKANDWKRCAADSARLQQEVERLLLDLDEFLSEP